MPAETDINFDIVITAEGITLARESQLNPGWYLIPKRWACSNTRGELSSARTTATMNDTWTSNAFSGVTASGTNGLLHTIVFGPQESPTEAGERIDEIYFIYEDHNGSEFLYAVAQPRGQYIQYNWGISQTFSFLFTLNNSTVDATFEINYTFPQDIDDHNNQLGAHPYLLARDGSRTATGVLNYTNEFKLDQRTDIVYKGYIDDLINEFVKKAVPAGTMAWWPSNTPPSGWLVRDGAQYLVSTYPELGKLLRNASTMFQGSNANYFRVPDDRGYFIRGLNTSSSGQDARRTLGSIQNSGVPNITGTHFGEAYSRDVLGAYGAFDLQYGRWGGVAKWDYDNNRVSFDASRCSGVYQNGLTEVRVINKAYLPIIKY